MKQAQVTTWGSAPQYLEVEAPATPDPASGLVQIKVLASGLHQLVRGRASGKHYSASILPHIPGADGVGRTVHDNKLVYFMTITPQGGSFSELVNVPKSNVFPVPESVANVDPVILAGMVNPVMASWMALATRTSNLPANFTVAILGAAGMSGAAAVDVARIFGAGRVVGIARSAAKMSGLGLDAVVELQDDPSKTDYTPALEADVILDFLYGPPALALLQAWPKFAKPVQYVQIGTIVDPNVVFPGDLLRSKDITMRGAGPGAWSMQRDFAVQCPKIIEAIGSGKIRPGKFQEVKLADIEAAWAQKGGDRTVVIL
ncbi:hypothetical protein HDV00_001126 [Rhizophlyctis rosea]|nr:hypothetical protein HDV00_001126 [Rhizophlyctis rosea]